MAVAVILRPHIFNRRDPGAGIRPGDTGPRGVIDQDLVLCAAEIYAEQDRADSGSEPAHGLFLRIIPGVEFTRPGEGADPIELAR